MRETRAVLVTGASAGIGHCVVRTLAERGHIVYGTIRKDSDVEKLKGIPGAIPLRVDVTIPEQIHEAVETVKNRGHGLFGLVNNAGIGELGMLNTWDNEDLRRIFDVNVFGPHRMTNAFLPFLLESRGRIVNIGSRGGMMSKPYFGPYTMTKHAMESYTETLRLELERYGVKASRRRSYSRAVWRRPSETPRCREPWRGAERRSLRSWRSASRWPTPS